MFTPNFVKDRKYILVSLPAAQSFCEGTRVACSFFAADTAATTGDTQTALQPTRHEASPSFGGHGCHYKRPSGRADLSKRGSCALRCSEHSHSCLCAQRTCCPLFRSAGFKPAGRTGYKPVFPRGAADAAAMIDLSKRGC